MSNKRVELNEGQLQLLIEQVVWSVNESKEKRGYEERNDALEIIKIKLIEARDR